MENLIRDRGYKILDSNEHSRVCTFNDNKILILFVDTDINIEYIGQLKEKLDSEYDHLILVKHKKITPTAKSALEEMSKLMDVEIFDYAELESNPANHELSPKYELVSQEEVDELLKLYRSTKIQFPKMSFSEDPIRRYYGWPRGSVIREIDGDDIYYRVVN